MFIKKLLLLIAASLMLNSGYAQLCQGSLGDAVVNITFGTGPNTGNAIGASVPGYTYNSNFCPNDGFYTIANSTDNCFNNTWLTLSEDHTPGDINGYMMLVNASFIHGDFYVRQVDGLCGGTTYEFAAWMVNVIRQAACNGRSIRPNITFNIETTSGQLLQTYNTGNIEASGVPVWKQYGLYFTTPANISSVMIRITNNADGGCGNDLALDDITFRPCGPKVNINVNGVSGVKNICAGDTTSLNFDSEVIGGYPHTFYQWQKSSDSLSFTDIPGANSTKYNIPAFTTPAKYYFRLQVADGDNIVLPSCRVASGVVTVSLNPLPQPAASNNGPLCEGENIVLSAKGGGNYTWTGPGNFVSDQESPVITDAVFNDSGLYRVRVISPEGCLNNDSTMVATVSRVTAGASGPVTICEGRSTQLQGFATNATSYAWSPAFGLSNALSLTPVASPTQTTLYVFVVSNKVCEDTASVLVSVIKTPVVNAGRDKVIVGNQAVTLDGQVTGSNYSFFWTPDLALSSTSVLFPVASPRENVLYTLHAISNDGCGRDSDIVLVRYFREIYVPNAFTPNGDGVNDNWNIPALAAFPLAQVSVYNRYGQLVFFNRGNTAQWDGSLKGLPQTSGVYTFIIELKNGSRPLHGIVTVIR